MKVFEMNPNHLVWPLVAAISLGLAGCDNDSKKRTAPTDGTNGGGGGTAESSPTVKFTGPVDTALGVPLNTMVVATFSKSMDSSTIGTSSFTLAADGQSSETGTVTLDTITHTATFDPTTLLGASTVYTATINTEATSSDGKALDTDYVWSFTTGLTADTTPPTVASTDAAAQAIDVSLNRNISAVFSEIMDPATITAATFTLTDPNGAPVPGVVSYLGTTAQFNPDQDLALSTQYTATITTGAMDLAANALAASFVWSFTTGTTLALGPMPVSLGTAGDYAVLAKSGISTTGSTFITGDIGVSPAAESFITGFSQARDSTETFATATNIVDGKIYAADMAPPTPARLTTAISDMEIAYTDAAGRTTPDFTEFKAGNVSGENLVPGLYKWGTSLLMASDVTLTGDANDVWIFQIAQDLTVNNGVNLILAGGALPKNIFWQVGGAVSLGTTSDFDGVILSKTGIVVKTGASLNGRALAQTAVTLDANAVTQPAE